MDVTDTMMDVGKPKLADQEKADSEKAGSEKVGSDTEPDKGNTVTIAGKKFTLGESQEKDDDLKQLQALVEREGGHKQWAKQGINCSLLIMLVLMNVVLGSKSRPSLVGVENCSGGYWAIFFIYMAICALFTWLAFYLN